MGCDNRHTTQAMWGIISIHAARMGCDTVSSDDLEMIAISIHAARMGCDLSGGTAAAGPG